MPESEPDAAIATLIQPARGKQHEPDAEKARYREVREKAANNPEVVQLREKMANTSDPEARKVAAMSYSEALFANMRKLDSSLSERIDRMEGATKRRIEAGKPLIE